ncbi:anti-sigma-28 factor, FlgM [Leptothrix cholodnii SP-6]|uniref:Negative regulator of flagellin synthesis n=1 Tax=Leptothrix cholodnii (strain ATCC 51168 / LMG 8142 / SP-6) TaxID=395495 RepID=B1XWK0_LEPCP|nr:flagellar biosynthesis anti-sigma factor FlgM [Leptothrix cholodnii]ACB35001.1 anti-sigma-28 factor, FlgM [Leptothrix cholodnii SP-6]
MKIGQTNAPPAITPAGSAATSSARAATEGARDSQGPRAAATDGSSTVQLSSTARALLEGADGTFDAEKVERVRQSISDGTYKINPDAIADKLIANAHEVLGKIDPA